MSQSAYPWYTLFYRNKHLLLLSILILLVAGASALLHLPRLEDPRIDTRNALVITPYPGASADRVEALVTDVLEDRLREIFEIKEIDSTSRAGISVISLVLQDWVDSSNNDQIFSEIRDAMSQAQADFPQGAGTPVFDEKRGATAFTLILALKPTVPDMTSLTMVGRLSDELADRLRNVHGTELVRIYGAPSEEIEVSVDVTKLAATGLSLAAVSNAIKAADPKLPAGVVNTHTHDIRVSVAEPLQSLAVIRNTPLINKDGQTLRVGDIATVSRGWKTPEKDRVMIQGERSIFVAARMQASVRADDWTHEAMAAVDNFNQQFNGTVSASVAFEQNTYTAARLSGLSQNLLMGCIVVMAVILIFMGLRASWIVGVALPLCAAFTLFSLNLFNEQIHQISIFGMIIAIGLLIDNAIVITDEIRINLLNPDYSRLDAMAKSVHHLFVPLLASTLTTILGFMPIFLLRGNLGDFVSPVAISVVMALIGSLFISLTIIASLAAKFLPRHSSGHTAWWQGGLQRPRITAAFSTWLAAVIQRPVWVLGIITVVCLSGFVLSTRLPNVFFPSADRDQFEIYLWASDGSTVAETYHQAEQLNSVIQSMEGVRQVTWLVGGSAPSVYYNQVMNRDNTPYFANAVVSTDSVERAVELIKTLQGQLQHQFPDGQIVVRAFGQGPPVPAPIEVDIVGPDLSVLNEIGQQVRLTMAQTQGVTQSIASITFGDPELVVDTNSSVTAQATTDLSSIAQQLQVSLSGLTGGSVLESTEDIPVRVRLDQDDRDSVTALASLPVMTSALGAQGQWVPLSAISKFVLAPSISGITRKDGERLNRIQAYLAPGVPAVDVSNQLRQQLSTQLVLPPGYRLEIGGDADKQREAMGQLVTYAPILLVLMITTLILSFSSIRMAGVIGMVAILSVGLGMFSLWISGLPLGFNPLLGSAGLIGVAINGSIVVIAAINADPEARKGRTRAVIDATMGCSRHILSTTFTTVGGLIPLLLFSDGTFWPPLAVVLAGGVGFSVVLSLVFTPTLVAWFNRVRARKQVCQVESTNGHHTYAANAVN